MGLCQLVVGNPGDDRSAQFSDRAFVQHAAARARGNDVDIDRPECFRFNCGDRVIRHDPFEPRIVEVAGPQDRAIAGQHPAQRATYIADTLDRDPHTFEGVSF